MFSFVPFFFAFPFVLISALSISLIVTSSFIIKKFLTQNYEVLLTCTDMADIFGELIKMT